jgi:hypothetical protein
MFINIHYAFINHFVQNPDILIANDVLQIVLVVYTLTMPVFVTDATYYGCIPDTVK